MTGTVDSGREESALAQVRAVKERYQEELLSRANVIGVGIGPVQKSGRRGDEVGLIVMVTQKLPRAQLAEKDFIPDRLEGVRVDVQEVGELKAMGDPGSGSHGPTEDREG